MTISTQALSNFDGAVAGFPDLRRVIDTPTHGTTYRGTDKAEDFRLRDYNMFWNPINRTLVYAEGGDDIVNGTRVIDEVVAGSGNDVVYGWFGDDIIHGGNGNDQLYGQQDNDYLFGNNGDDYMDGGQGNDYVYGGAGNDLMYGAFGDDSLFGGDGHDAMYGNDGRDMLTGGGGHDILDGGQGRDTLTGGYGADRFVFSEGIDVVVDFTWSQGDRISLNGFQGTVSVKEYFDPSTNRVHTAVSKSAENFMVFNWTSGLEVVEGLKGNEGLNIVTSNFSLPGSVKTFTQENTPSEDLISSMVITNELAF